MEQKIGHANRQKIKYGRLATHSLDEENKRVYKAREDEWDNKKGEMVDIFDGAEVYSIGRIDKSIYSCVTKDIITDEVIITKERIEHINERHPEDFEKYKGYLKKILEYPDFIVEANRSATAVILKEFIEDNEKFKLILKLAVKGEPKEYKNSVISFWKIGDKTWKKISKNKIILYKSHDK